MRQGDSGAILEFRLHAAELGRLDEAWAVDEDAYDAELALKLWEGVELRAGYTTRFTIDGPEWQPSFRLNVSNPSKADPSERPPSPQLPKP